LPQEVLSTMAPPQLTVNIVGQQDAGKSSVLNNMVGRKVCPEAHGVVTTKLPTLVTIDASNQHGDMGIIKGRTSGGEEVSRALNLNTEAELGLSRIVDAMQSEIIKNHETAHWTAERIMKEVELNIM
jgi:septin family protein